jgi:hypothetical protein
MHSFYITNACLIFEIVVYFILLSVLAKIGEAPDMIENHV